MSEKPLTEVDLSPYVIDYWEKKGYCVHGEVATFKSSHFLDHVAHTGPCSCPEHVVGIEMKKGAGKGLRSQLKKIDRKHYADELWGAVISSPQDSTLDDWEKLGMWLRPGLLVWEDGQMKPVFECEEHKPYKRRMRKDRLLLVEENRKVLAGYPANAEVPYITHWKRIRNAAKNYASKATGPFLPEDVEEIMPPELKLYKNPTGTVVRALRELEEHERLIRQIGKEGKSPKFEKLSLEKDELLDDRFLDLFEIT